MANRIRRHDYFYMQAPNRPGVAARLLDELKRAGVNLRAFSGFPSGGGAQLDFVPDNPRKFVAVARKAGWKLKGPKRAFLVEGTDRPGALASVVGKLGRARINVTAVDAVCAGAKRWGAILWVKPKAAARAARVLGAR